MAKLEKIKDIVKQEVKKGGFDGFIKIDEFDEKPHFYAAIDTKTLHTICIKYNPFYEKIKPGKIYEVIKDITRHEINHKCYKGFNGCPRNLDNHVELIFEPIADVLLSSKKNYTVDDIHYLANALEDTILHSDLNKKFSLEGMVLFFEDVGENADKKIFTDFYEAHVRLNLYLWGSKKQKKKLKKYFAKRAKEKNEVKEVLQNFLKRTGIADLKQKIIVNGKEIEVKDREKIREFLNNEENWPKIARIYAEEFSKLMKPFYAMPLFNHSGKGTKGREKKENGDKEGEKEGNPFDREMYDKEFKKKRIRKAYKNNESIPPWLNSFEALDLLYESLAQKLNIKIKAYTKSTQMPIYYFGRRAFDPEKDNLKHVVFGFDDKGKIELKKKRWHVDIPLEYKVNPKGFPEIRFCLLDASGSMKNDPQGGNNIGRRNIIEWGDNSKYHYALLAWYGVLEYLKKNQLLKQTTISLASFSSETILGYGLTEAKKVALNPQFENTYIDLEKIKILFKGHGILLFTISDGEIMNWESIKNEFIKLAKNHFYFHFHIGRENEFTQDLKKAGFRVEYIENAKDLAYKVIDLTDKLYRGEL